MKKLVLLFVALFAVVTLVACGTSTKDDDAALIIFQNKLEIHDALNSYATAWGEANGVDVDVTSCGGDGCPYQDNLLAELQGNNQPDIFVIEGLTGFLEYQDLIVNLEGESWIAQTDLAFMFNGTVYGFPVSIEGWGMAYNVQLLADAGIDPASLTSLAGYQAAFTALESQKETLGILAPVSMAAGPGMTWVTGLHNFNGYLSAGLDYDDDSVLEDLLNGQANEQRLSDYADWVELLFDYAIPSVLTSGNYDQQVAAFFRGDAAFLHQGNWIDPDIVNWFAEEGLEIFEMGYAPHASVGGTVDSIFISAPSWYVINKDGNNVETAKQFLQDMAMTAEGHEYMVNGAKMVPAFNNVTLQPSTPLSAVLLEWSQEGKSYAWWQNNLPAGFGMNTLGPVYQLFAAGTITKAQFIDLVRAEIEDLG